MVKLYDMLSLSYELLDRHSEMYLRSPEMKKHLGEGYKFFKKERR